LLSRPNSLTYVPTYYLYLMIALTHLDSGA
jgi:hypothetical protein